MSDPLTISIDLGVTGALAILAGDDLLEIHDLPVIDGRLSGALLLELLPPSPRVITIEKVHAMPTGTRANFSMGTSLGVVLGVAGALATPVIMIAPSHWKKVMRLQSKAGRLAKEEARELAIRLWPDHAANFVRVMDHNRAEAALIGRAYSMLRVRGEI